MKSFEEFRQDQLVEQEQLDEIKVPDWLNPLKWVKGAANLVNDKVVKPVVGEIGKTAKKTWDGGDNKIGNQKGSDERGLKSSN